MRVVKETRRIRQHSRIRSERRSFLAVVDRECLEDMAEVLGIKQPVLSVIEKDGDLYFSMVELEHEYN